MKFACSSLRVCLLAAFGALIGGCIDSTLAPRSSDINQNTQNARESAILMNIVRASRSEPLNFVALSKYTGTGSLSLNESLTRNFPATTPTGTVLKEIFGSSVGASQANAFDVGTLENRDFYGGFMSPLDLEALNLLLNAGLNKELVLQSVLAGFRVRLAGRSFLFNNNPDDDVPFNGTPCSTLYDGTENAFEPVARRAIWSDLQACRYQKFLYFLRVGVRWGVTVEVAAPAKTAGGGGKSSGKSGGKSGASDKSISGGSDAPAPLQYFVCYDPAIAQENGMREARPDAPGACGSRLRDLGQTREFQFRFQFNSPLEGVAPIVRSPYAVFQFYGQLLANHTHAPAELSELSRRKDPRRESRLLTIRQDELVDCFASTFYNGVRYCVPNEGSKNTKEIFVLLNTLVALSTNRSALPVSPTFLLTP
jgi:hypothetical protein